MIDRFEVGEEYIHIPAKHVVTISKIDERTGRVYGTWPGYPDNNIHVAYQEASYWKEYERVNRPEDTIPEDWS